MTSPGTGDDFLRGQGRVPVMRTAAAWLVGVLLLVGGCGSDTAGTPAAAADPAVIEACEDFSTALSAQAAVIASSGPKADYDQANEQIGDALQRGQDTATGELGEQFTVARQGWEAEQAAGGVLPEEEGALLTRTYWDLIDACAAIGAEATRPPT